MKRREFIALLAGAAAAWPVGARAQQADRVKKIGFLGAASSQVASGWLVAFQRRLQELGWIEGRNIAIEVAWAEGRKERATEIAAEFVRLNVDLILTWGTEPAIAVKKVTSVVPMVFALATDPIGSGLVASLARPGGNATGLSALNIDLIGKRLELLRETTPSIRRIAILANVGGADPAAEMREVQGSAGRLGLEVLMLEVRRSEEIAPAFNALTIKPDALFVVGDPLTISSASCRTSGSLP
jgi:putative ABC transport system substrate-binding protein